MGRKTAQRVILELGESIRQESVGTAPVKQSDTKPSLPSLQSEAVAALTSLGYDGLTASRAVAKIKEADNVEELITKALKSMAKR
jgi:Holliday junction DNA helicase RuvA